MKLNLENKIALVCAASKGLGKAVAMGLQEEGARVAICARDSVQLEQAKVDIEALGGHSVLAVVADLTESVQILNLFTQINKQWGEIDILVNNAGGPPAGSHDTISDEQWQQAFELTVRSAGRLTDLVLPAMKQKSWGRIVNISSFSVKQPMPNMMLSNSLRLSTIGWAKSLATELGPHNILVNTVCPGWTETQRVSSLLEQSAKAQTSKPEAIRQSITNTIPMGRMGRP